MPARRPLPLLVAALIGVLAAGPRALAAGDGNPQDILVIANTALPLSTVSMGELRNIFLKKKSAWHTGASALPVHAQENTVLRKQFRDRLLQMSATAEREYWKNAKIKQALMEPPDFANTLKAVFKLRGAVSYVFRSDYKDGVAKIVMVLPAS